MDDSRTFALRVRTFSELVVDARAQSLTAEDRSGRFGIRRGIEPLVAVLIPGMLTFIDEAGVERLIAVDEGVLHAERERVEVAVRHAFSCSSLEHVREEVLRATAERRAGAQAIRRTFQSLYQRMLATLAEEERAS